MMLEYTHVFNERYHARFALNIDNLMDDQSRYGYIYAPGRSFKLTSSVRF
jgi:hypothetical protein